MKKTVLFGVAASVFIGGFALGQSVPAVSGIMKQFNEAGFQVDMNAADGKKYPDSPKNLADAYAKVVSNADATKQVLAQQIATYNAGKQQAENAVQRQQNASETMVELEFLRCAQNQRIIELLEKKK